MGAEQDLRDRIDTVIRLVETEICLAWIRQAITGKKPNDFGMSFPVVQQVWDLVQAAKRKKESFNLIRQLLTSKLDLEAENAKLRELIERALEILVPIVKYEKVGFYLDLANELCEDIQEALK